MLLLALAGFVTVQSATLPHLPEVYRVLFTAPFAAGVIVLAAWLLGPSVRDALRLHAPPRALWPVTRRVVAPLAAWYILLALAVGTLIPLPRWIADAYERLAPNGGIETMAVILALVIVAPVLEETLVRGVCLTALTRVAGPAAGALASALVFGFLHVAPAKIIATGVFGWLLARLALATRSVWPGVFAHALANAIALSLGSLGDARGQGSLTAQLPRTTVYLLAAVAAGLAVPVVELIARVESAARDRAAAPPAA